MEGGGSITFNFGTWDNYALRRIVFEKRRKKNKRKGRDVKGKQRIVLKSSQRRRSTGAGSHIEMSSILADQSRPHI